MVRGTFANIRIRNFLAPGTEGGVTKYLGSPLPLGEGRGEGARVAAAAAASRQGMKEPPALPPGQGQMISEGGGSRPGALDTPERGSIHPNVGDVVSIYDAAMAYKSLGVPTIVLAGAEYGTGSSRDWAAKGTMLLGVRAVIAQSFERIHRSNLVNMGVLPLQFLEGQTWKSLGLTGEEIYEIAGLGDNLKPRSKLTVRATAPNGSVKTFEAHVRIDTPVELDYYRNGGILQTVVRKLLGTPG
jgi:aconitase A